MVDTGKLTTLVVVQAELIVTVTEEEPVHVVPTAMAGVPKLMDVLADRKA